MTMVEWESTAVFVQLLLPSNSTISPSKHPPPDPSFLPRNITYHFMHRVMKNVSEHRDALGGETASVEKALANARSPSAPCTSPSPPTYSPSTCSLPTSSSGSFQAPALPAPSTCPSTPPLPVESTSNAQLSNLLPSNPPSPSPISLDHESSHHAYHEYEAWRATSDTSVKRVGKLPETSLPQLHFEIPSRENIPSSSISSGVDDASLASAVDLPTHLSFTENHGPRSTLPEAVLSKLIIKYANKLENKLSLRKISDKRFAPAGTARDFFDDNRLRKLFKALFEVQKYSDRAADQMQEERIEKLIAKVKGQGGSEGLFNVLATLVHIRCDGLILEYLEAISATSDLANDFRDTNLPFRWEAAISFFGMDCGRRFFHSQNIYTPFTFIEGVENRCCSAETARRLPILERKHKGSGAYGDVFDVTIEKGGWRFSDGSTNRESKRVAQKVFKGAFREEAQHAFLEEHDIHLQIGEDPTSHKHLVHCLGSLEYHDDEYSLFFELADRSLEDLLVRGGMKSSPAVIFACAAGLCGGLDHLHHGLSRNGNRIVGYHLDFRPQNILIYGDLWKVADFGLSRLKHSRPGLEESPEATPNRRGDGTFVAPEASLNGVNSVSDLWSLGAVLIEVITFAVGGSGLVKDFRGDRITAERHDRFFVERNGITTVNEKVTQWGHYLRSAAAEKCSALYEVVNETLNFLEHKVLVVDVKIRKQTQARDLSVLLYKMSNHLKEGNTYQPASRPSNQSDQATIISESSPELATPTQIPAIPQIAVVTQSPGATEIPDHEQSRFKTLTSLNWWIPFSSSDLLNYVDREKYNGSTFGIAPNGIYWLCLSEDRKRLNVYPLTARKTHKSGDDVVKSSKFPEPILSHRSEQPIRGYHVSQAHLVVFPQCGHFQVRRISLPPYYSTLTEFSVHYL